MNHDQIVEVGKALLPYLRADINHVDLGHAAFNAAAALNRVTNSQRREGGKVWHMGPETIGGWPIYDGDRHIGSFWNPGGENNARRACELSERLTTP